MFAGLRQHLTYANVVSSLCLFILLGGAAYAATALPSNSVGTKQLKRNAVVSSKVKDHSLLAKDFKGGQLPQGAPGRPGAAGTALAFAHVLDDGTLDAAGSKNVIDVRPKCQLPCNPLPAHAGLSLQCFKLSVAVRNAVVSTDISHSKTAARVQVPGPPADFASTGCPPGYTSAEVFTFDTTTGNGAAAAYYVLFN
jgi:hypothetical protein